MNDSCSCPLCNGRGWILYEEDGVEVAKECECGLVESERANNKLRFADIPETYRNVTLKDVTTKYYMDSNNKNIIKGIKNSIQYWLEHQDLMIEQGKGLYLWSNTKGSGKTMTASAIANELMNTYKKQVKFSTSMDILGEIKASWDKEYGVSESRLLRDLTNIEYLVIDDFGTEKARDWVGEKFYQIINKRYINKRITIFTSNYDVKHLPYDDRIGNRILERSFIVKFPEESVREVKSVIENKLGG